MSEKQRISKLSEIVDVEMAVDLNKRFEKLKKSGNLANWEARAMGTDLLKQDKKLKGALARLEALDDLGVLNPKQMEGFMESFIELEMGISLTMEESKKVSELVNIQRDNFDELMKTNDWTHTNEKNVSNYLESVRKLEDYTDSLKPTTKTDVFNKLIDYARASILASTRILRNSFLYQLIPGIERTITKRIVSGNFSDGDLKGNIIEKLQSKLSGTKPSKASAEFIKKQVAMGIRIYHKTGYDISRMQTLDDGYKFFGEKVGRIKGRSVKDAKGIKAKIGAVASQIGEKVNLAPKWMAGGTDMLFANIGRADTSLIMSKEIAHLESMKGKLPKGMTEEQRADQLLKDSYSFTSSDPQAQKIRTMGILDAHMMNNTQPDGLSDKVIKFRDNLGLGKLKFGKAIIPFAKIATTAISDGLKTATGYGTIKAVLKINHASKLNGAERSAKMQEGVSLLIRYLGFAGAAILLASLLDDDDYIAPYNTLSYKEYKMARARGAGTSMIRIGGKWIPMRFLPIINIPLASIMSARQAKSKGGSPIAGYLSGIVGAILETPGVKETKEFTDKLLKIAKSEDIEKTLDSLGLNKDIIDWAKVRMIPSILSYDLYNKVVEKDKKYDFLGREIKRGGMFKDDRTNEVLIEFSNLDREGNLPAISDPSGKYAIELEEKLGDKYTEKLAEFQRNYAEEVLKEMNKNSYQRKDPDEKKDKIDKIRQDEILDELKKLNKKTKY